jgi:tetratricopeptide (TPR) repeat protein
MVDALYLRGAALWRLKRFDAALDSYNLALAAAPGAPTILNSKGVLLCSMGRYEAALDSFAAALAAQPDFVDSIVNRGIALASLNRHQAALDSFDQALALRPDHRDALNNKASVPTRPRCSIAPSLFPICTGMWTRWPVSMPCWRRIRSIPMR